MAPEFDPYHKWLGILPKDQPPNHYRLLGLELHEDDPDVISAGADRQQTFLRSHQSGPHGADASRLMNEVARARLCLLKPETKRAYDSELRQRKAELLSTGADEVPPQIATLAPSSRQAPGKLPAWALPAALGGCACVALALLGILTLLPSRPIRKPSEPASNFDNSNLPPAPPRDPAPPPPPKPAVRKVDLLAKIDLSRDIIDGAFTRDADGALSAQGRGRCRIPFAFPEDYRVALRVERLNDVDTLGMVLPCAGRHLLFAIDGWYGAETGFYIDGRDANGNCATHRGRVLTSGKPADVVLTIHPRHVTIECDGATIVDWHGDPQRLSLPSGFLVPETTAMLNPLVPFRIHKMELTPLDPEQETRAAQPRSTVNLLEHVDLQRDVIAGEWSATREGLRALKGISHARVQIGDPLPREYTLRLKVQRPAERPGGFIVAFPTGDTATQIVFDVGGCCGLDTIDDLRWDWSEARVVGDRLPGGIEHDIAITVRRDRIGLKLNGSPLIDWQGDFSRLGIPGDWANPDSRRATVGGDSEWNIPEATVAPPEELPEIPSRISQTTDLLALVDVNRDAYWGEWVRGAARLQAPPRGNFARLALPTLVPDEYVLTLDVERQPGELEDALLIGLPVGPRFAQVVLDGWGRTVSGMYLDGQDANATAVANATRVFETGQKRTVTCTVHRNRVQVECAGRTLIDWRGDPRRLSDTQGSSVPLRGRPFVGSWNTSYVFSRIELSPSRSPTTPFPSPRRPVNGNLLGIVQVDRDAVRGDWKLEQGILRSPACRGARLEFPVDPPQRYVLSAIVTRRAGNDSLFIDLPVGGHIGTVLFDGFASRCSGLELLDGLRPTDNETRHDGAFLPTNQAVRIDCVVAPDSVLVLKDGTEFFTWRGDPRRLGESPGQGLLPMSSQERRRLAVGSWTTEFEFSQVTLTAGATPPASLAVHIADTVPATPVETAQPGKLNARVAVLAGKTPVPDAAALAVARAKIQSNYAQDFSAAREQRGYIDLAEKLLKAALESRTDLTAQYALLDEARQLWVRAGQPEDALRAVDELSAEFDVNGHALRVETLTQFMDGLPAAEIVRRVGRLAMDVANEALNAGQFDVALRAADLAAQAFVAGRDRRDASRINDAHLLAGRARVEQQHADAVARQRETLQSSPGDPAANLAVGAYHCFQRNEWEQGLPYLARGDDAGIQQAAQLELGNPTDPSQKVALAEAWSQVAAGRSEPQQRVIERHARTWYRRALPQLSGLSKTRVEKKLAELAESSQSLGGPVWHPGDVKIWKSGAADTHQGARGNGFAILAGIGGQFEGGQEIRLRVNDDGLWLLQGTGAGILAGAIPIRTRHDLPVREYAWRAGEARVQTIHRDEGILFLSGVGGAFAGGGEAVEVRLGDDDHWYLEGRSGQASLHAWATSIQLGRDYQYTEHAWKQGQRAVKLLHKDEGFCCLTRIAGAFRGGGEVAGLSVGKDGYWYLGGKSAQVVELRAISVRLRKFGR